VIADSVLCQEEWLVPSGGGRLRDGVGVAVEGPGDLVNKNTGSY
jgi:hypothetical protein